MESPAETRKRQQDYLQLAEEPQRRTGVPPFKNGAEALQSFRDLFDSDEEMERSETVSGRCARRSAPGTAD